MSFLLLVHYAAEQIVSRVTASKSFKSDIRGIQDRHTLLMRFLVFFWYSVYYFNNNLQNTVPLIVSLIIMTLGGYRIMQNKIIYLNIHIY